MENYKKMVKRRIILFAIMALAAIILGVYGFLEMSSSEKTNMEDGIVSGYQFGINFGIGALALIQIIKLSAIIKDEKKLKMLYNKEHDERLRTIRSKAGMPMLLITSILMLIASIIAGYFNVVVFYTLVIAASAQLLIGAIVKLYCIKTM